MGVRWGEQELAFWPFEGTRTLRNLRARGEAVVHLTDDVLLYGKVGAWAVHERLRFGGTPVAPLYDREQIAVRPDARVGVEWAITDRLSVAVEAGVVGNRLH